MRAPVVRLSIPSLLTRWLLDLAGIGSLILCLTAVALRVRGHFGFLSWSRPDGHMYCVQGLSDKIVLGVFTPWPCSEHRWEEGRFPVIESQLVSHHQYARGMETFS